MRWYKHLTNSGRDPKLTQLTSMEGNCGYGAWWRLLETVAEQIGDTDLCEVSHPIDAWSRFLCETPEKTQHFLTVFRTLRLAEVTENHDHVITVKITNLLKYRDEYSNRKKKERYRDSIGIVSGVSHEQDTDTEAEAELESKKKKVSAKADPRVKSLITYFYDHFLIAQKKKYIVNGGKDGTLLKALLQSGESLESIQILIDKYLSMNGDTWLGKQPKSVGLFCSKINDVHQYKTLAPGCLPPEIDYDEEVYFDKQAGCWACKNHEGSGSECFVPEGYQAHKKGQPVLKDGGLKIERRSKG